MIYEDGLQAGWSSGALGSVLIDEQSSKHILAGDFALGVVYNSSFGRFYLRTDTPLSVEDIDQVHMALYAPNRSFKVSLLSENFQSTVASVDMSATGSDWTSVEIDLSSASVEEAISYVMVEFTDNLAGTLYIDNVYITDEAGSGTDGSGSNNIYLPYVSR